MKNMLAAFFLALPVVAGRRRLSDGLDVSNHTIVAAYVQQFAADRVSTIRFKDVGNPVADAAFVKEDPRAIWRLSSNSLKVGIKEEGFPEYDNMKSPVEWLYATVAAWTDHLKCATPEVDIAVLDSTPGVVENIVATGNVDYGLVQADLVQVGFRGAEVFPPRAPWLAYCWTFVWEDENGVPTDIDGDGRVDVAFREIYYNTRFQWSDLDDVPEGHVDFPTIALHEFGHGLGLEHFGTTFEDEDGGLHAHPRAAMNPVYDGMLREPTGRDKGAYCNAWASW